MQLSPVLLIVSDAGSLTCMGMGGPRLELTWDRDGTVVANGAMGNDVLQYNFTANNDTFGTYTCNATIDDMGMSQSVDVVGMCCMSYLCVRVYVCVCVCARVCA